MKRSNDWALALSSTLAHRVGLFWTLVSRTIQSNQVCVAVSGTAFVRGALQIKDGTMLHRYFTKL